MIGVVLFILGIVTFGAILGSLLWRCSDEGKAISNAARRRDDG